MNDIVEIAREGEALAIRYAAALLDDTVKARDVNVAMNTFADHAETNYAALCRAVIDMDAKLREIAELVSFPTTIHMGMSSYENGEYDIKRAVLDILNREKADGE